MLIEALEEAGIELEYLFDGRWRMLKDGERWYGLHIMEEDADSFYRYQLSPNGVEGWYGKSFKTPSEDILLAQIFKDYGIVVEAEAEEKTGEIFSLEIYESMLDKLIEEDLR